MKLANKQLIRSVQSWINRVERRHPPKVGYHSELRDWVQHVIMETEKNKDFEKKLQRRLRKRVNLLRLVSTTSP